MKAGPESDLSEQGASTTDAGSPSGPSNGGFEGGSDEDSDGDASEEPAGEATSGSIEPVDTIEGIGPTYSDGLEAVGVETIADLLAAGVDELAAETGIPAGSIERWLENATDGMSGQ